MAKLKSTTRVKMVNGKALTASMLLGIALEYVDAINSQEVPVVMNCFERVVQVESRRFTEKLFEEITQQMNSENSLPLLEYGADESLQSLLQKYVDIADSKISNQLSEVASVENLIEIREEFEQRLRTYFKESVKEQNTLIS